MNIFKKLFGKPETVLPTVSSISINDNVSVTHVSKLAYFEALNATLEAKAEAEELRKEIARLKNKSK
jgi:hypothetical protein